MSRDNRLFGCRAVTRHQEIVSEEDTGIEQPAISSGPVIGYRSLKHMPNVVELVAGGLRLGEHPLRLVSVYVISVEIAAGFLHGYDLFDHLFGRGAKLRTIARL